MGSSKFGFLVFQEDLVQHTLQVNWALGLIEKWFCIWMFRHNRKINITLEPKPILLSEG